MSKVVGILLAAGKSSRFGSNKCLALLPDQVPMALRSAQNLLPHVDEVIVIIPPDNAELAAMFAEEGIATRVCKTAEKGMSESLKEGVRHFDSSSNISGYLIALADMPLIKPETYHAVVSEFKNPEDIVAPQYLGKRGHPVGLGINFKEEILSLSGDQGAKGLFQKYAENITLLSVDDQGVLEDFDTCSKFEQFASSYT